MMRRLRERVSRQAGEDECRSKERKQADRAVGAKADTQQLLVGIFPASKRQISFGR